MHLPQHQEILRNAAECGGIDAVTMIDSATEIIRNTNPRALHVETGDGETLSQRVFFHQPASIVPMKSCVHVYVPREAQARATQRQSSGATVASNSSEANDEACALAADAA